MSTLEEVYAQVAPAAPTDVRREGFGVATRRGTVLPGTLFRAGRQRKARVAVVAITGIHGNFWSNPFYYNIGDTLAAADIDFVYAETEDAQSQLQTYNVKTGEPELIGSFNEDFSYVDEDVGAYVRWARAEGYDHVVLAGHSLGANKVIDYLSGHHDPFVAHFVLLSPANLEFLVRQVTVGQRRLIDRWVAEGRSGDLLPFELFGWAPMLAGTARQWIHDNPLDNVHLDDAHDFSQVEKVGQSGAIFIGTLDAFALGDPRRLASVTSAHFPKARENRVVFVPHTGHTYRQREQWVANALLRVVRGWERRACRSGG